MDVDRYDMLPGERSDEQREHDNVLQKYRDADNARLAAEQAEAQRKQASEAAAGRWTAKPTAAQLLKKSMKATAMASALSFNTTAAAAAARKAERGMFAGAKYGRMQPGLMEGHAAGRGVADAAGGRVEAALQARHLGHVRGRVRVRAAGGRALRHRRA